MAKKKKSSSRKSSSKELVYIIWVLSIILLSLILFVGGYYLGQDDEKAKDKQEVLKESPKKEQNNTIVKPPKLEIKEQIQKPKQEEELKDKLKDILKKDLNITSTDINITEDKNASVPTTQNYENASHEIDTSVPLLPIKREKVKITTKPKLAIIIDDVSVQSQVNAVKSLNLVLTMSFLPPSKERPSSHILAQKEHFYMVHLPMEAQNFTKEEPYTLRVGDSQEEIAKRVEEIKKLFPRVKYINNHTGSKFTADEGAVDRLITTLNSQHINFLDSRTVGSSKVASVMKKYGKKYVGRDVFLDHQQDKEYVKSQIKKAIEIAKEHGSAVAIGHPHVNTLQAIRESKAILGSVELVYVDRLY